MRLILVLLAFISLCSCNSTKEFQDRSHPPLTKENLSSINGTYEMSGGYFKRRQKVRCDRCVIRLTAINSRRIRADQVLNDSVFDSSIVHGRLRRNGYFSVNQRIVVIPTFPIYFLYRREKQDMILTKERDLYIASSSFGILVIFIMSGGDSHPGGHTFKRISE